MTADERELIRRFHSGETQAFETVYALYGPRIYRFCLRLCLRSTDAEDLTQEVFVAAFQGRQRFEGRSPLTTWLYRIALYQWRARCADQDNQSVPLPEAPHPALTVNPMGTANERIVLDWAISTLPVTLRETFVLVKAEGLTCVEAAIVLEVPVGTVKYRIHEATQRLRTILATAIEWDRCPVSEVMVPGEVIHEV